ncbi:MAG: hypothetical protein D6743_05685 [Calditrichaeota bacterium]|nr:MAG: hypothetical protein D6743_05685 [Calditrichota bacterium]
MFQKICLRAAKEYGGKDSMTWVLPSLCDSRLTRCFEWRRVAAARRHKSTGSDEIIVIVRHMFAGG